MSMKRDVKWYKSINIKIVFVIVLLLIFALEIIGANFITQLENQLVSNHKEDRQTQVNFIETSSEPYLNMWLSDSDEADPLAEISGLLNEFGGRGNMNIQIIDPNLSIIGTSIHTQQSLIGKRTNDIDVRQALLTGETVTREYRDSTTGDRRWKIVSPVASSNNPNQTLGVVLLESNIEDVYEQVNQIALIFVRSSLIAIVLSILLAYVLSKEITDPIIEIQEKTKAIANEDYSGQLEVHSTDEIGQLADLINELSLRVSTAQESIDAERRRLDKVLTHMSDGVIATNRRGEVIITNQMAREMLNITKEESTNKMITDILGLDTDMTIRDIYENTEDILMEYGSLYIRVNFSLIQSESGFIQGIVSVLHDVTESERIEQDRKIFVSNVSHELRTPLTSMRSYVEALTDGAWKDPEIAPRFLSVIRDETDRMIRMVSDLLQLSRIDAGTDKVEKEIVDFTALFNHVLDRFEMLLHSEEYVGKNFNIKRNILKKSIWVEVDADRMTQVIDNVMNNAIKYSPDGGTITATLQVSSNRVILSITDEGIGMEKSEVQRIFSRFYRVDKARSRAMGGTGLGLAISKEVVEQHQGRIWALSEPNKGTVFYIALPYEEKVESSIFDEEWD